MSIRRPNLLGFPGILSSAMRVLLIASASLLPGCLGEASIEPVDGSIPSGPIKPQPGTDAGRDATTNPTTCTPTTFVGTMTIRSRSGSAPPAGTSCSLTVGPRDSGGFCHVSVICAGREWYATQGTQNGYLGSCTLTATGFTVTSDPQTTSAGNGGDPALTLSMTSLTIQDDTTGANGAFQFTGTTSFQPVGPGCPAGSTDAGAKG
jgi:hypothetical protein